MRKKKLTERVKIVCTIRIDLHILSFTVIIVKSIITALLLMFFAHPILIIIYFRKYQEEQNGTFIP